MNVGEQMTTATKEQRVKTGQGGISQVGKSPFGVAATAFDLPNGPEMTLLVTAGKMVLEIKLKVLCEHGERPRWVVETEDLTGLDIWGT
jgi:hypothetical protein